MLIWWFVVAVEEGGGKEEGKFQVGFYGYGDAARKFTFRMDREVVEKAI